MSEFGIYLCNIFHNILYKFKHREYGSNKNRRDYLPFVNSDIEQSSSLRHFIHRIVLLLKKVKSVGIKWKGKIFKSRNLFTQCNHYNHNIFSSNKFGFHMKPNSLMNTMEYNKIHYACTCSNSCNSSSFKYCRNRYDKQYDFKYGVWSRATSLLDLAPEPNRQPGKRMYGRYTKELGEFAKEEAKKLNKRRKDRLQADELRNKYRGRCATKFATVVGFIWKHTFAKLGEDWVFLALLGIIMATISFFMDRGINIIGRSRMWLYKELTVLPFNKYLAWVTLPICLILFSAGFVHIVAPQSIGSGIPEMKTILRGVALKEYLTFNTLVAKIIGLTATLGSGLPLGKEGPFVHIASIVATLLSKLVTSFQGIYENESRNTEMLAAACAVGVGSCFGAPIGGVLFSIEVTTVYFAIRNYWRGFFTAVCGATVFRLLAVWFYNEETMRAFFPTNFTMDFPFDPQELTVFALIGVVCGFGGAGYVWSHRQYVLFMRRNKKMNAFLQKNRFLYPGIVVLIATSVSFPLGLGKYMAGDLNTHDQLLHMFSNFTWTKGHYTVEEQEILKHWTTKNTDVFVSLTGFMLYTYIFSIIASTIPVPSGSFIPVFKIGAAFGRMVGEIIFLRFPDGITHGKFIAPIIPGGYATVGAAAFSGAVTHTISVSVIMFEMTGQITHIIPVMIAVLISNAVAALLQPSLYDSIILIKKLPYLPDLLPSSSGIYNVYVEDFMVRDVKYIWNNMSYRDLKNLLKENRSLRVFPLVESSENMILLGSIQRIELIKLIEKHIGRDRRLQMVAEWQKAARERFEQMEVKRREEQRQRRPSRFEVTPAPDLLKGKPHGVSASSDNLPRTENLDGPQYCPVFGIQPKKSILKKTNSFSLKNFSPMLTPNVTPYTTVTGAESRIRMAFEAIFHKSATLQDANPDPESGQEALLSDLHHGAVNTHNVRIVPPSPGPFKKVQLPRERVIDMSPEDQKRWEEEEMGQKVSFEQCHIDPAPFQLVERTSLLKVHSIFSLVGVNHAYVTAIGKLVGVVGLKELRKAIENSNSGISQANPPPQQQEPLLNNQDTVHSVSSDIGGS